MATVSRRFRRRPSRAWLFAGLLAALVAARLAWDGWHPEPDPHLSAPPPETARYEVERAIDGDTVQVRASGTAVGDGAGPRYFRVRLLGIDCPETVHPDKPVEPWGPEAAAFTRDFVLGRTVRLQFDRRRVDAYNRYLAYVYVDERMLNEELVRAGLAVVTTFPGDSETIARRLRAAETEARQHARGVWSGGGPPH